MIIRFDWVSKFTLSLLSALKVSITFDRAMNGIHCLNRSNRIHYWCYSNQWYGYNTSIPAWKVKSEKVTFTNIWGWIHLEMRWIPGAWNLIPLHQKQTREKLDIGRIFTSKRGGIFAKIRCAFQIITLKESSISNTLYILGVNLFSLFSA